MPGCLSAKAPDQPLLINGVDIEEQHQPHERMDCQTEVELKDLVGFLQYPGQRNDNHRERQQEHDGDGAPPQPRIAAFQPLQVLTRVLHFVELQIGKRFEHRRAGRVHTSTQEEFCGGSARIIA